MENWEIWSKFKPQQLQLQVCPCLVSDDVAGNEEAAACMVFSFWRSFDSSTKSVLATCKWWLYRLHCFIHEDCIALLPSIGGCVADCKMTLGGLVEGECEVFPDIGFHWW